MAPLPFHLIQVFDNPQKGYIGNTSTVVFLEEALSDEIMQRIAADQLQPATTFLWKSSNEGEYNVRWFAPDAEIGLCGHGSLAAMVYLNSANGEKEIMLNFKTDSLKASVSTDFTASLLINQIPTLDKELVPQAIKEGLDIPILGFYRTGNKHIILTDSKSTVQNMKPDFSKLRQSKIFGYAVTAQGDDVDFVSRTLVPHVRQLEDPATGSSHAALFPFWNKKLGKTSMIADQLSARGGTFKGELLGKNLKLSGSFKTLAHGIIEPNSY